MPTQRRSARFQVSWCDDFEEYPDGAPDDIVDRDFIVLELLPADVKRLHKQLELASQFGEVDSKEKVYLTVLLHGKAYPQFADGLDGTRKYPPSLLSEEVLAETPRPERWKP